MQTDQDRDPQTIEEAKQQLDRAVAQMDHPAGLRIEQPQSYTSGGGGGGGGGVGPTVAPTPHPPPTAQETECARMCRAFASMQRAQTALCRMAGDDDTRCAEAKKVVEDNAKRVAHCGCH